MKALLLAVALALQSVGTDETARLHVEVSSDDGETLCTVVSHNAPLYQVVREIAERADLELDGFRGEWKRLLVNADLQHRPLRQVLAFLLGSVDLTAEVRQGALYIHPVGTDVAPDDLYEDAIAAYQRLLRDFPGHERCAEAMKNLGDIEELRGDENAARQRFEALIARFPDSDLVPEALLHVGHILAKERDWEAAKLRYEDLLRFGRPHAFEHQARIELVRCLARTDEGERALDLLDQLDSLTPAKTLEESIDRRLLRARSLLVSKAYAEALTVLEGLSVSSLDEASRQDFLELEARASEATSALERAAKAWLSFARGTKTPEDRVLGFQEAARISLAGGDELGTLFVAALARSEAIQDPELARLVTEARVRLRIELPDGDPTVLRQRVERGERLLAAGVGGEALEVLHSISKRSGELDPELRLRFALAYGRSLAREINLDAALASFREILPSIATSDARRQIYVLAGDLLDRAGRTDEAIEAYRGKL